MWEGRENLEGRISGNCAEGGKSTPQAWLVVPAVGGWGGGVRARGAPVALWNTLPATSPLCDLGLAASPGLPFQ